MAIAKMQWTPHYLPPRPKVVERSCDGYVLYLAGVLYILPDLEHLNSLCGPNFSDFFGLLVFGCLGVGVDVASPVGVPGMMLGSASPDGVSVSMLGPASPEGISGVGGALYT